MMFHPDFDHGLGKERMAQMRKEVQHNRLEAGLAREARLGEEAVPLLRGGVLTRGTTFVAALLRQGSG
jgi:hypothetical protein